LRPCRFPAKPCTNLEDNLAFFLTGFTRSASEILRDQDTRSRRRFFFLKPRFLFILDEIDGPPGRHSIEQFWHTGARTDAIASRLYRIGSHVRLVLAENSAGELSTGGQNGWRSLALGQKQEACVIRVSLELPLPLQLAAVLDFSGKQAPTRLSLQTDGPETVLGWESEERILIRYPAGGIPSYASGTEVPYKG